MAYKGAVLPLPLPLYKNSDPYFTGIAVCVCGHYKQHSITAEQGSSYGLDKKRVY
jgi:hypothetical protein